MASVPYEPSKRHRAACLRPLPAVPVHHRQTVAENVNAGEHSGVEDAGPALTFEKCQPQQREYARAKFERVLDEFCGISEGGICNDSLRAFRRAAL